MTDIQVQFAPRYMRRKWSDAIGKSLLKTLTEPITNSDDSYRKIVESGPENAEDVFPITIFIDKPGRLVRVVDNAQGMTAGELELKFKEYGAAKSGAYEGYSSRGIFGQGISDVLFFHRDGKVKSIKDGEASICSFFEKREKPHISIDRKKGSVDKIAKAWGLTADKGTVVEFVLDDTTTVHDYDNLVKKLSAFYMLRLINANDRRVVKLIYKDNRGTRESVLKYQFPQGELVEHKEFLFNFEHYDPVKVDVELYKSGTSLLTTGDERENGLLVSDDKEAVYAQTFFGLDSLPSADKFFGFMKLTGAREIILDKINAKKHPEAILSDSRDGFNLQHDFYKKLASQVKDWLYPILSEERRKRTNEGVSEATTEKHRKALEELNKLYAQLSGDDISGTIRSKKLARPVGGMEFARSSITVTAGKRYGLQLTIDTRVIQPGSKVSLKSANGKIGFTPAEIVVGEVPEDNDGLLVKTVIITGTEARTADTLKATCASRSVSVVVSIVSEEVVYPEKGIVFSPDYARAVTNRESRLHLYVDLNAVKVGSEIIFASSNGAIALRETKISVPGRMRSTNQLAKIEVLFVGLKSNESGVVEATFGEYSTQCRVDIKDRVTSSLTGPSGKFRGWDFDDSVPRHMQTTFDSIRESPTQGYILINSSHPINRYYFGDNPLKKDVEQSHKAQLYLAELILNESLGAMIPEAYQKGVVSRNYGPEYDIPVYIAQKKFELGQIIYSLFVEEQSASEAKREKQLTDSGQVSVLTDGQLATGLDSREGQMIQMRFGLNDQRPHTLEEIAQKFGITRERVRQIINRALARKDGQVSQDDQVEEKDYIEEREKMIGVTIAKIVDMTAQYYMLKPAEIKRNTRKANIVIPRQVAMYLIREVLGLSFPSIGNVFGREHSTVIHAFDKVREKITNEKSFERQIADIRRLIAS